MLAVRMQMYETQFLYMLEEEESVNFHTLINHVQTHKR
jgi:AraC-like DNA-binding protein